MLVCRSFLDCLTTLGSALILQWHWYVCARQYKTLLVFNRLFPLLDHNNSECFICDEQPAFNIHTLFHTLTRRLMSSLEGGFASIPLSFLVFLVVPALVSTRADSLYCITVIDYRFKLPCMVWLFSSYRSSFESDHCIGIYATLFCQCMYIFRNRHNKGRKPALVVGTILMFLLSTVQWGLGISCSLMYHFESLENLIYIITKYNS